MNIVQALKLLADKYHNQIVKQKRKYTHEPYTTHTDAVVQIYASMFPDDLVGQAIAVGHDLFEDTPLTSKELIRELVLMGFSPDDVLISEVIAGIQELTDEYTKVKYPQLNRQARKLLEQERLGKISVRGKNIKMSDLIHNTASIVEHDAKFARTYLKEVLNMLPMLLEGNKELLNKVACQTVAACAQVGVNIPTLSKPS